jgi:hypothetical protein
MHSSFAINSRRPHYCPTCSNTDHGDVEAAFDRSCRSLDIEYIDLFVSLRRLFLIVHGTLTPSFCKSSCTGLKEWIQRVAKRSRSKNRLPLSRRGKRWRNCCPTIVVRLSGERECRLGKARPILIGCYRLAFQGLKLVRQEFANSTQRGQHHPRSEPGRLHSRHNVAELDVHSASPVSVQVEAHPYLPQTGLHKLCKEQGIHMTAYSRESRIILVF